MLFDISYNSVLAQTKIIVLSEISFRNVEKPLLTVSPNDTPRSDFRFWYERIVELGTRLLSEDEFNPDLPISITFKCIRYKQSENE